MGLFGYPRIEHIMVGGDVANLIEARENQGFQFERTLDQGFASPSLSYVENNTIQFASSVRMARHFQTKPLILA